jgi:hypothetical protein
MEKGIESLRNAVLKDCAAGENCFSENGCTKERYSHLPETNPGLIEMGMKTRCVAQTKCFHDYCGKYKWVLERAKIYAAKCNKSVDEVVEIWETNRTYWYMNYYQECKQPIPNSENIIDYDEWIIELHQRFGDDPEKWAFKCPNCGNIQTAQDFLNHMIEFPKSKVYNSCIGRYVDNIGCNWTLGGLFQIHKTSVLKDAEVIPVFEMADVKES